MVSLSFDTMSIPQGTRFRPAKLHVPRRGDAQEHGPRAALLRVQAGGAPVWPDVAVGTYRLNLGAARADRCGRLAWDARPAPPLRAR